VSGRLPKVAVFIDWQNTYRGARRTFGLDALGSERGNYSPYLLGEVIARGNGRGHHADLVRVDVHRGLPSRRRDPAGHAAARRQSAAWVREAPRIVVPHLRPLGYPRHLGGRAVEKGVDVQLAVSALEWAVAGDCDVAVVFSHDSDLLPAVEAIVRLRGAHSVEVASWASTGAPLSVPEIHQHVLSHRTFRSVETPVNYARRRDA
jgi:hypothetical protein